MAPLYLEGDTLGEKHRNFNKLVAEALANKHYELRNISADDNDLDNLLKINIACKTRNVDYIIEVMKSNDMLYATTAIKKSTWLITEQQYANIINPEYLHTQLLPSMNTKTFNKLMRHIRLNLKDETRVETFYAYLKDSDDAYKWLEHCTIPFIQNVMENGLLIPLSLFKRLCRRSAHFLTYYRSVEVRNMYEMKKQVLFLLKSHTTEVLNVVEDKTIIYSIPEIGKKKTEFIMKNAMQRVLDNFGTYVEIINLPVLAKCLKNNEIKDFLCKHAKTMVGSFLFDYQILKHFIKNMPAEERFEFAKKTFIDKTEMELLFSEWERKNIERYVKPYQWYEFAPFDVALSEIQTLIRRERSSFERCAMLSVLVTCTRNNPQHVKTLLNFFNDKHINEPFKFKIQFVNNLLSQVSTHEFDSETWNVLNQLFHSMEVYTESENNVQLCLQSIVLYKVLHNEPVPEIVEQKMQFRSFKKFQTKLNQEQKDKIFTYLINTVLRKIQIGTIANVSDFDENLLHLQNVFILLRDWKKDSIFPSTLEKIQELLQVKHKNMWKTDMSCLYNVKKSWRKYMFEESLSLCLSEETCLNALKHKPQLLTRHDKQIDTLRTDDAVSLPRLLAKLRVYWPHSLAQHWVDAYLLNLNKPTGQKAVIKGLFMLLPQNQVINIAKTYAPNNFKITWGETDQAEISIKKNIAKNLHLARPLIALDTVLWYAKGDYLQYAMPSLNALLNNTAEVESLVYLPKLLEASVSLQKFGLHLAFNKLKSDFLKSTFVITWNTTKNLTIRSILFKHTYDRICKVKNPTVEKELWELLGIFMEELNSNDSPEIYKELGNAGHVPISIRAEYFMRSFEFLTSLPGSANCGKYVQKLVQYSPNIIESLDEDFVANKLLSQAGQKLCSYNSDFIEVLACYVLSGETEEKQLQKYRRIVGPAMEEAFKSWDNLRGDTYYVKNNFKKFLNLLVWSFPIKVTLNKIPIPAKLFSEIKTQIEQNLPLLENYVMYTSWKLITEYVKIIYEDTMVMMSALGSNKWTDADFNDRWSSSRVGDIWKDINLKIAPSLGPTIVNCLNEDIEQYSPTIFCPFTEALGSMLDMFYFQHNLFVLDTLKNMLNDNNFIHSYLVVSTLTRKYYIRDGDELGCVRSEIRKKLKSHQSEAVLVHYYNDFGDLPED